METAPDVPTAACSVEEGRDGCCVQTAPLSSAIAEFVDRWEAGRPSNSGQFVTEERGQDISVVTALEWLEQEAALRGRAVPMATIKNIKSARYSTTELRVADQLLAAIGRTDLIADGTIPVMPNPRAPRDVRAECCAGSQPPPSFEPWSLTGGLY